MSQKYFLILFIGYLPVYLTLLLYLKTKIRGYSMRAHMVSFLATSNEPWRSIFNVSTILYGMLSLVLPASLNSMRGANTTVGWGTASLLAAGTATALVGFFPMDRRIKIHNAIGFLAFFSVLLTGIIFFTIFDQGTLFSPMMEFIDFAVICTTILLGTSLLLRRQESSLLEWLSFLCALAWNFLFSMLLLTKMF
jgi:hypothetical protein